MAKTFHLTIAKVGENLFVGEAVRATFPGSDGVFTVLAGHEPFVSTLSAGEALVEDAAGEERRFPVIKGGVLEVSGGQATVLL